MSQPDLLQGDAVFLQRLQDHVDIAARIDDHALMRIAVEENRTVLLERGYRNDPGLHLSHGSVPCFRAGCA